MNESTPETSEPTARHDAPAKIVRDPVYAMRAHRARLARSLHRAEVERLALYELTNADRSTTADPMYDLVLALRTPLHEAAELLVHYPAPRLPCNAPLCLPVPKARRPRARKAA